MLGEKYKYDYLIVGAGLAGATFAWLAGEKGYKCLVVEKRKHVGGNLYTENINGINVHKYGPHIFHTSNKYIWSFVNQFTEFMPFQYSPVLKSQGMLLNLPFNMNTFNKLWNIETPENAKKKILEECAPFINISPSNLEEQALSLVGEIIYNIMIKGYTEKQWGIPPKELPAFIIKRLPIRFTYDNNYFNDTYQGIPTGGYTPIIEKMLKNADVILNVDFLTERETFSEMARTVIYTGCIDGFFDFSLGRLQYRSLQFKEELIQMENYQGCAVVNYGDTEVLYTRIIEHKHFEHVDNDFTIITKEYPMDYKHTENTEPYYPINDKYNDQLYEKYEKLADEYPNSHFIGRLANYTYYNMDQIIENVYKLFNQIIKP